MSLLQVRAGIREALAAGRPMVALESTVVAHGLPWPDNLETARAMLAAVRAGGAEPAVVGVTGGHLVVGLEDSEIERFARSGRAVGKVSRRDLAAAVAGGGDGATTVAATMIAAARAGIRLFATGGIGGVHRSAPGAGATADISADLTELARTPVCVVSSGAKSILDLPRTLEALESLGVPVVGFGTRRFPTFYSRDGALALNGSVATAAEAAALLRAQLQLDLGGMLLANPLPEAAAIASDEIEGWLAEALAEAEGAGITGPEVTPYLLAGLHVRSGGRTLEANRLLLIANAGLAAEVARALGAAGS